MYDLFTVKTELEEEEEEEEDEGMKFLFPFYCFGVDSLFICICGPSNFSESMLLVCEKRLLLLLSKFSILWNLENVI